MTALDGSRACACACACLCLFLPSLFCLWLGFPLVSCGSCCLLSFLGLSVLDGLRFGACCLSLFGCSFPLVSLAGSFLSWSQCLLARPLALLGFLLFSGCLALLLLSFPSFCPFVSVVLSGVACFGFRVCAPGVVLPAVCPECVTLVPSKKKKKKMRVKLVRDTARSRQTQ